MLGKLRTRGAPKPQKGEREQRLEKVLALLVAQAPGGRVILREKDLEEFRGGITSEWDKAERRLVLKHVPSMKEGDVKESERSRIWMPD